MILHNSLVNLPANVMVLSSCSKRFTSDLVGELGMPKNIMRSVAQLLALLLVK